MTIPTGESDDAFRAPARRPAPAPRRPDPTPRRPIAQQEVDENGYSYPEPPKELQLTIERRPRPSPTTTPRPQPTTTTPFAEAPLPIYGAPSQPFRAGRSQQQPAAFPRAGFGTRNRSGRIVKVLRRRKRKLNKDSGNKLESDSKKPEDGDGDDVVSAAAKFAQAVDVVTLNLREENESNSVEEEGREE